MPSHRDGSQPESAPQTPPRDATSPDAAAPSEHHAPPAPPHRDDEPLTRTGNVTTVGGALPTITGAIPVLEDDADRELCHRASPEELDASRGRVTALMIAVLTTLSAIGPLATDMYIPAFPEVMGDLGTTPARLQLSITAFFMGTATGQIVAGPLSDRLGRRGPLLAGIILCLIGSIGCMVAPNAGMLLVFRILQGIGGGFGMVLGRAVLIDLADGPELFRTMNLMQGIGGIAPIVAPLLGGLILLVGQWREVFAVIAVMSVISLLGALFVVPESLPPARRHAGGFRTFLHNVRTLLTRPVFVSYLLVNAFSAFALMAYVSASSFVVQDMLGFSASVYSVLFAINSVGMMSGSFLSARLTGSMHPRTLIRAGLIIASIGAILLLVGTLFLGTPAWIVIPAFFLLVAPQGMIFGNGGALASSQASEFAGTGSAMLGLGFSFAASAAAPIVGIAGNATALPMAVTMIVGLAASWVAFLVARRGMRQFA